MSRTTPSGLSKHLRNEKGEGNDNKMAIMCKRNESSIV